MDDLSKGNTARLDPPRTTTANTTLCNMASQIHRALTTVVGILGHPATLIVVVIYGILWRYVEPETFDFHAIATLVAVGMTLVIQRGQNRDTAALQAKLDELILATSGARNEVAGLDEKDVDDIDEIRSAGRVP